MKAFYKQFRGGKRRSHFYSPIRTDSRLHIRQSTYVLLIEKEFNLINYLKIRGLFL